MENRIKLVKVSKDLYRNETGNLVCMFHSFEKGLRRDHRWIVKWKDFMNCPQSFHAATFEDLNSKLRPYGMRLVK